MITTDLGHSVGTITNEGTIEKTVTTGTTTINSAFDNSGTINVQTGTISLDSAGGTNTGGSFTVASGASLDLTGGTTVDYIGSYTGSGAGTISLESGTLAVGSGGATFNFPGPLFQWTGGIINTVSGNLTNTGTINLAGTTGEESLRAGGTLTNDGTINQTGAASFTIDDGSTLDNSAGNTINFQADAMITTDLGHSVGTITNEGTIEKTVTTGTTTVTMGFGNSGTVEAISGILSIPNAGLVASNTLSTGIWDVGTDSTLSLNSTISTLAAIVDLQGPGANFTNLSSLSKISAKGELELQGGRLVHHAG